MRSIAFSFALILIGFIAACSHIDRPAWIEGQVPPSYPDSRFMVGMGQGGDLATAQDRARAEIAKQFSIKVEQLQKTLEDFTGMEGNTQQSWILKTSVSELTRTYVNQTLEGVAIRESFIDPESGQAYALATLERAPAVMRLERRVIALDFEIKSRVEQSGKGRSVVQKARPLVQALELMKEREIKNTQLTVVNAVGSGVSSLISPATLNEKLNRTLSELKVAITVEGDNAGRIREAVVKSLNNGRLTIQPEVEGADLIVRGQVKQMKTNPENRTGFVFAKTRATLELIDNLDGTTFGLVEHTYRDGAKNWTDAQEKVLMRLADLIVTDFNQKFYGYLSL